MNKKTLKALRGSIKKWQKIYMGKGEDKRSENCPLCRTFPGCSFCPVEKRTKGEHCWSSPWKRWMDHQFKNHPNESGLRIFCPTCKRLAKTELDFLKSLLSDPEGEKR